MEKENKNKKQLLEELEELRIRLEEAEERLSAIRSGEVDAIVVSGPQGDQVFTLTGAERTYRVLFEEINEGAVVLSSDGIILYCNRRFAELVFFPLEQIVGSNFTRFVAESDKPKYDLLLQAGLKGKSNGEITCLIHDSNPVHLHLSFSPLPPDMSGNVCIMAMDITELKQKEEDLRHAYDTLEIAHKELLEQINKRKRADQSLRESEEKYRTLVENIPQKIFTKDRRSVFMSCNENFARDIGITPEQFTGKTDYDFSTKELADKYRSDDMRIMETGETEGIEEQYILGGKKIWTFTVKTPLRDKDGNIVGILGVFSDITERRNLEAQLLQAQKMEAVGQLAGGIAHDFNNILTAMIGYGHLLKMRLKEEDPLRSYADNILSLSDRAANLTHSLLAFSRKQMMNPRPVDLNEIMRRIDHLLSRIIGEDIQIQTMFSEEDLIVMADSGQIEQVLMNLATNARDAMPKGGLLSIGTEKIAIDNEFIKEHGYGKEGEYALVALTDTGAGMDRETREKIFEPFFTTKEVGKGTGLGLAMVYGIIKQHEGYINVYSEPGRGTTFRIYLPLTEAKVDEINPEVIQPVETGTETVLLAEDEAAIREFIKKLLEKYGYKVITAANGQEAINEFKAHKDKIQLVLLDVIMPNKNGREVYEEIKKISPDIKVLFMSGYPADIIDKHEIVENGFAYIEKPASPAKLLRKIREVLGK